MTSSRASDQANAALMPALSVNSRNVATLPSRSVKTITKSASKVLPVAFVTAAIVPDRHDRVALSDELARLELLEVLGLRDPLEEFGDARLALPLA